MAKDPAILFYTSDFLTGVQFMNDEQVGRYIKLLCLQHQHGHLSEKHMLSICKAYDEDVFDKFEQDSENLYYNSRLDKEIERRSKYTESRRNNALGKGKKKNKKVKAYAKHMETENETINETINNNENKGIKHKFGELKNVLLTDEEVIKLKDYMGDGYENMLLTFSEGIGMKDYKYKSHYLAMRKWYKNAKDRKANNKPMNRKERTDQAIKDFIEER